MGKSALSQITPEEEMAFENEFQSISAKIDGIFEKIKEDQAEIDRLKLETRSILNEMKVQ